MKVSLFSVWKAFSLINSKKVSPCNGGFSYRTHTTILQDRLIHRFKEAFWYRGTPPAIVSRLSLLFSGQNQNRWCYVFHWKICAFNLNLQSSLSQASMQSFHSQYRCNRWNAFTIKMTSTMVFTSIHQLILKISFCCFTELKYCIISQSYSFK